jgi:hypothetical protein
MKADVPQAASDSLLRVRSNRSAGIWLGLWVVVSILAWSLAFTFRPAPPYKYTIKILHVLVFLPWSVASIRGWRALSRWSGSPRFEFASLVAVAALIELSEHWIPGHEPDWIGFSCSCLGATLAVLLIRESDRRSGKKCQVSQRVDPIQVCGRRAETLIQA